MKKLLFLGAMAAMLLGTASCSNDMEPEMTGDGNVQFTIELPGNIDSRAISDGENATKLQIAVYKEDGTLLENVSRIGENAVTMSGKKATVNFKLVKGLKYSFAFWAQNPGEDAYAFDASTGKVTVDYSKAVANADDGDAFTNSVEKMLVTGPMTETIYLYRPFAQLNYGDVVADYEAAVAAGIDFSKTQVTVKQVSTEFDVMGQKASSTALTNVTWPAAASAIANEELNVENVDYKWLSMCYFLVPNDEATVNTELSLLNNAGTEFNKLTVDNVPVQKNHRTNILGNLFTDDVNFNIIIDERFDQPDLGLMSDPDEIAAEIQKTNAVVSIAPGIALDLKANTIAEGVTISANGSKISFGANEAERTLNAANVTIDNCIISNKDLDRETEAEIASTGKVYKNALIVKGANFTLSNCSFAESSEATANRLHEIHLIGADNAKFENCSFEDNGIFKAILVDGASTMTIDNCVFDATYPFNCNSSTGDVVVNNSKLYGWTSWNNGEGHTVEFNNCEFGQDTKGTSIVAVVRPYTNSTFTNCKFSADMRFSPQNNTKANTSTFTNCTWSNGDALNEPFLSTDNDPGFNECVAILGNVTWKNLVVDGVQKWVQQ